MSGLSKNNLIAEMQNLLAGVAKHLAGQTLPLNGGSIKAGHIEKELTAYIAELQANATAYAAWKAQVAATKAGSKTMVNPLVKSLHRYILAVFVDGTVLADFGMTPPKVAATTPAQKVAAATKSALTRTARHTMGKNQRAAIKATPAAPSSPAPVSPSTPAPSGSGGTANPAK